MRNRHSRQRLRSFSNALSSTASFFNGWRSTPSTTPATSQLDKLISITAINVLSCFKTIRDRFRSFGFCIGGLHRVTSATMCAISSPPPHSISKNPMFRPTRQGYRGRLIWLGARATITPSCCTGVVAAACTQGKHTQHGKPQGEVSDDQPDAREGQAGRPEVAERFVVLLRPGNAGGAK